MRPTLAEQLRGLRHILEVAVGPALTDDYAIEALAGVQRALAMLETREADVLGFLRWDNEETARVLHLAGAHVPLAGPVVPPLSALPATIASLDAENERLRGLLAAAIPALAAGAAASPLASAHAAVVAHLRERIIRYPYVSTGVLPAR